jgi:hypothetical protein
MYPTSRASSSRAILQLAKPRRQTTLSLRLLSTKPTRHEATTSTYGNQSKVPRLPVPDLEKSMEAYVKSLVPLLEQKVGSFDPRGGKALTGSTLATIYKKRSRSAKSMRETS